MKQITRNAFLLLGIAIVTSLSAAPKREKLVERLVTGEYVLEEIMADTGTAIPASILQDAHGILLTINYRGGFFIGGHAGTGILIAKNPLTGEWGVPAFVKTGGANIGLQLGIKEFDTIYVIMDSDTVRKAYSGRLDFGADAAAVAGPIFSATESRPSIDYQTAKILVYTSKKGLYAGVAVKAGWVAPDNKATQALYDTSYRIPEIVLSDWFELPPEAVALLQRLNYYTEGGR